MGAESRRTTDTTGLAPPLRFGLSGRAPGPWGIWVWQVAARIDKKHALACSPQTATPTKKTQNMGESWQGGTWNAFLVCTSPHGAVSYMVSTLLSPTSCRSWKRQSYMHMLKTWKHCFVSCFPCAFLRRVALDLSFSWIVMPFGGWIVASIKVLLVKANLIRLTYDMCQGQNSLYWGWSSNL